MEDKSMIKKIGLIAILVIIIGAIIFVVINSSSGKKEAKVDTNATTISKVAQSDGKSTSESQNTTTEVDATNGQAKETKPAKVTTLEDGIKYSVSDEEFKPEIVIGDNFFGTQLADISMNFAQYEGKTIEIEGLYFTNTGYTFVGRYSTSAVCPTCPTGYSYFEYEWHGDKELPLKDSENWIKVQGTLKKGNDGVEYYYIDVANIELMNKKGIDTVSN